MDSLFWSPWFQRLLQLVSFSCPKIQFSWIEILIGLVWMVCPLFGMCVCMSVCRIAPNWPPTKTTWSGGGVRRTLGCFLTKEEDIAEDEEINAHHQCSLNSIFFFCSKTLNWLPHLYKWLQTLVHLGFLFPLTSLFDMLGSSQPVNSFWFLAVIDNDGSKFKFGVSYGFEKLLFFSLNLINLKSNIFLWSQWVWIEIFVLECCQWYPLLSETVF